jgi:hypothetical protein
MVNIIRSHDLFWLIITLKDSLGYEWQMMTELIKLKAMNVLRRRYFNEEIRTRGGVHFE